MCRLGAFSALVLQESLDAAIKKSRVPCRSARRQLMIMVCYSRSLRIDRVQPSLCQHLAAADGPLTATVAPIIQGQ